MTQPLKPSGLKPLSLQLQPRAIQQVCYSPSEVAQGRLKAQLLVLSASESRLPLPCLFRLHLVAQEAYLFKELYIETITRYPQELGLFGYRYSF